MRRDAIVFLSIACCLFLAFAGSQDGMQDRAPVVLSARMEQSPSSPPSITGGIRGGNLLFRFNGQDNAECVRAIPDVNNDGKDEIIAGFGWDQDNENLYCLDGASSGIGSVVWKLETMDGASGGYFWGEQCLVPTSDVDQNGFGNFLAGTAGGGRTAYNMDDLDGSTVWKLDTYTLPSTGWVYSLCECGDINGDGVPETAFGTGSDSNTLFLIDGASQGANPNILWQYPAADVVYSVRCIGDVNFDGLDDVLGAVGDYGDQIVCLSGSNGLPVWTYDPGVSVYACGVLPSINSDDVSEAIAVLWTSDGSAIRCLDGRDGSLVWSSTEVPDYGMAVDVLQDVTDDQIDEIIVASWENAVIVLSGTDGTLVWKTTVGTTNGGDVWSARAIPDLNGDSRQDVIAGSFDYHVYAMDGDSGEVFWKYNTNNRVFSVYPAGDLNDDGRPEVVAGTQNTNNNWLVYVLEGDADIPWPGLTLIGTGAIGENLEVEVTGDPGWLAMVMLSTGSGYTLVPPYGVLELAIPFTALPPGVIPPEGPYRLWGDVPNDPNLIGITLYFQALAGVGPGNASFTDMESITFF